MPYVIRMPITKFPSLLCDADPSIVSNVPVKLPTKGTISKRPQNMPKNIPFFTPIIENPIPYIIHNIPIIIPNPVRYFWDTLLDLNIIVVAVSCSVGERILKLLFSNACERKGAGIYKPGLKQYQPGNCLTIS